MVDFNSHSSAQMRSLTDLKVTLDWRLNKFMRACFLDTPKTPLLAREKFEIIV